MPPAPPPGGLTAWLASFPDKALPVFWALLTAAAILFLGRIGARLGVKALRSVLTRAKTDPTLVAFLGNLAYAGLLTLVVIAALERLGVNTTSFAAVVGACGLAVGFALSGSLSSFAAGVMLILFQHFRVGDLVEAGGQKGVVEDLHVFFTILRAEDGTKVICPNASIIGGVIKVLPRKTA